MEKVKTYTSLDTLEQQEKALNKCIRNEKLLDEFEGKLAKDLLYKLQIQGRLIDKPSHLETIDKAVFKIDKMRGNI